MKIDHHTDRAVYPGSNAAQDGPKPVQTQRGETQMEVIP